MRRIRYGAAALAAVAFLLTGCGGAADSSGGQTAGDAAPAAPAREAATDGGSVSDQSAGGGSGRQEKLTIDPAERSIVYRAELMVEARDVTAAADRAKTLVTAAGGYVSEERSDSFSGGGRWVIAFKVPPARYPGVLAQLGRDLGTRKSMSQNAQDVTEEVADVASRVKSAEAALAQFRTLLTKAEKIGEILEIEREIASRESELESLQARQRALEAQTAMATVTLTLVPPPGASTLPEREESGFLAGLRGGWDTMVRSAVVALTVLGALLPWLVVGGLAWAAGRAIVRRMRRRTTLPTGPDPAAAAHGPATHGPATHGPATHGPITHGPASPADPAVPAGGPVPAPPYGPEPARTQDEAAGQAPK